MYTYITYLTCRYMCVYMYTYITYTVSFHNFKSHNFKSQNPKSKHVAYVSVLSQISHCQGLGRKKDLKF